MMRATAVIGANHGDEGKGLVVDALAESFKGDATVIRYNSSAQAGHTVARPNGDRHVFHHVGAGSLAGAATLLSRYFVAHPMLLGEELDALASLGVRPTIMVEPDARIALPYDILINQAIEVARGNGRHGSCGVGFNEAVERGLRPRFRLTVRDALKMDDLSSFLKRVREIWVPSRLAVLGIQNTNDAFQTVLNDPAVERSFERDVQAFLHQVQILEAGLRPPGRLIFEGAQGLLLDEDGEDFPHVTRSKTGLRNVARLAREMELSGLDPIYVTRGYATRHGAGPLAHEDADVGSHVDDATNIPNAFQGSLRFGRLDGRALKARISEDAAARASGLSIRPRLAITCLDQTDDKIIAADTPSSRLPVSDFVREKLAADLPVALLARGPCRETVEWFD